MAEDLPEVSSFLDAHTKHEGSNLIAETTSQEFVVIAEQVGELTGTWNPVEIYTPDPESLKQEKEKFFEAFRQEQAYEPAFTYGYADGFDISGAKEQLPLLLQETRRTSPRNERDRLFRVALRAKIMDDLATCDLLDGIQQKNEELIASASKQKYPPVDLVLLAHAENLYQKMASGETEEAPSSSDEALLSHKQQKLLKESQFNAEQIKEAFEWALNKYGVLRSGANPDGFQVVVSPRATAIDVRDKSEDPTTIYIPTDRVVSGEKLGELIAHEIEAHARQSMNGLEMFILGGGKYKMDGEILYEGLAKRYDQSYHQRFFGVEAGEPAPWYTLAANLASQGASFSEIFHDQYQRHLHVLLKVPADQPLKVDQSADSDQISKAMDRAWTATYRVMRGHTDMSNPYGFAMSKDLAYLKGDLMDKQLRQLGFGGINEMAVIQSGGMEIIARLGVGDEDIPHKYQDVVKEYIFTVMLPQLESEQQPPIGQPTEDNSSGYSLS